MKTIICIDETYYVQRVCSISKLVDECKGYYTQDGRTITRSIVSKELKGGYLNVYRYDDEEVTEARERGSVIGADWIYKFQYLN